MNTSEQQVEEIAFALVCLRTGIVLRVLADDGSPVSTLSDTANASPELFGVAQSADWAALFARFGSEGGKEFREIVLVSAGSVRVMERLPNEQDVALVAIASGVPNVGLVLSGVRRRMLELAGARGSARDPSGRA
ncbi:MAG: hypothetical protein QM778_15185 [Myxococcales bacterium]